LALNTISKKFLLPTLALTLLSLSGLGFFTVLTNNSALSGVIHSKGNAIADFMSKISVSSYQNFDFLALESLASEMSKDPEVAFAIFYDPENKPLTKGQKPKTTSSLMVFDRKIIDEKGVLLGSLQVGYKKTFLASNLRKNVFIVTIGGIVALLLLALGITVISRKTIIRPIMEMKEAAERIASGELTHALEIKGEDEIASLGRAIHGMTINLRDIITKIRNVTNSVTSVTDNIMISSQGVLSATDVQKQAVENTASAIGEMDGSISEVAVSSESLYDSAANTASAISQMTTTIETIAENANVFSETAHETASSIEEMVAIIKEISDSLETLVESSEAIAASIEEVNATTLEIERSADDSVKLAEAVAVDASEKGMNAAEAAMKGMENIKSSVSSLSETINMLGKRTNDIWKIVNVIDDVADQTNLLAINAAILASKAGEHGKGFAVVADEIKSLAERTTFSTSEIAGLIKSVQDDTKSSIKMAGEGIQTVDKGLTLVKDVSNALKEIVGSSNISADMAKAIQRSTNEQTHVIKQITKDMENTAVQTENISRAIREQSKGSQLIIDATEKIKDIAYQVKTSTAEQRTGSRQIAEVIENVTQQVSHIAKATANQKEKSLDIVQSVDMIRNVTNDLTGSAHSMNSVITSLKEEAMSLLAELEKFKV
jgi:methyl-accepting chemotaxis protein